MIDARDAVVGFIFNRKHGKGWTQTILTEEIVGKIFGDSKEYALNDFEPIPLTPERLEALGFKVNPSHKHLFFWEGFRYDTKYNVLSILRPCDKAGESQPGLCGYSTGDAIDVRFLHHLQNIIHCLTGKELTYSPNNTVK